MTIPITDLITATAENSALDLAYRGAEPGSWWIALRVGAGELQIVLGLSASSTVHFWDSESGTYQEFTGVENAVSAVMTFAADATVVIASKSALDALVNDAIDLGLYGSSVDTLAFDDSLVSRLVNVSSYVVSVDAYID